MMLDVPRWSLSPPRETLPRREPKSSLYGWEGLIWVGIFHLRTHHPRRLDAPQAPTLKSNSRHSAPFPRRRKSGLEEKSNLCFEVAWIATTAGGVGAYCVRAVLYSGGIQIETCLAGVSCDVSCLIQLVFSAVARTQTSDTWVMITQM